MPTLTEITGRRSGIVLYNHPPPKLPALGAVDWTGVVGLPWVRKEQFVIGNNEDLSTMTRVTKLWDESVLDLVLDGARADEDECGFATEGRPEIDGMWFMSMPNMPVYIFTIKGWR